jgi:hypothetical protein
MIMSWKVSPVIVPPAVLEVITPRATPDDGTVASTVSPPWRDATEAMPAKE